MDIVRIYCDEDVHSAVWRGLQRLGIDAVSVVTEGRLGQTDHDQLRYATTAGRVLLTHNVQDFPRIHAEFGSAGEHHGGIIVARRDLSIGEMIRWVARLAATLSAEDMLDRLKYLSSW